MINNILSIDKRTLKTHPYNRSDCQLHVLGTNLKYKCEVQVSGANIKSTCAEHFLLLFVPDTFI